MNSYPYPLGLRTTKKNNQKKVAVPPPPASKTPPVLTYHFLIAPELYVQKSCGPSTP
jgi:hypothetical protein